MSDVNLRDLERLAQAESPAVVRWINALLRARDHGVTPPPAQDPPLVERFVLGPGAPARFSIYSSAQRPQGGYVEDFSWFGLSLLVHSSVSAGDWEVFRDHGRVRAAEHGHLIVHEWPAALVASRGDAREPAAPLLIMAKPSLIYATSGVNFEVSAGPTTGVISGTIVMHVKRIQRAPQAHTPFATNLRALLSGLIVRRTNATPDDTAGVGLCGRVLDAQDYREEILRLWGGGVYEIENEASGARSFIHLQGSSLPIPTVVQ